MWKKSYYCDSQLSEIKCGMDGTPTGLAVQAHIDRIICSNLILTILYNFFAMIRSYDSRLNYTYYIGERFICSAF